MNLTYHLIPYDEDNNQLIIKFNGNEVGYQIVPKDHPLKNIPLTKD